MQWIYSIIGTPLGWIMWLCYKITSNYGIALLLFTLIVRGALLPFAFKQQKSSAKMMAIKPQMDELQKKYANNREKQTEEMQKLYQKEGYNPLSGCLPMLIQMPILFGLIDVIYRPMKHILRLSKPIIDIIEGIALEMGLVQSIKGLNPAQIIAANKIRENITPWLEIGQENIDRILSLNLNFLGINLGLTPDKTMFFDIFTKGQFNGLILVPVLSGVSALAMSLISLRTSSGQMEGAAAGANGSMKAMMLVMPLFSFFIAFNVPAGVGIYWFYSNLFAIAQSLILNKFYNPKELAEQAKKEVEERQERERQERIEAKKEAKKQAVENADGKVEVDEKAMTQKEINRKLLAEARRRDAEKYGETYVEVTDEDLR